jgi:hypothetical protein
MLHQRNNPLHKGLFLYYATKLASPEDEKYQPAKISVLGSNIPVRESEKEVFGYLPEGCDEGLIVIHASIRMLKSQGRRTR